MPENFANRYQTTLSAGVTSGALTGTVTSTTGIPATPFRAIISSEGANSAEIVLVISRSGTTLTWTRAAEAIAGVQAASAHASGATFTAIATATGLLNATYINVRSYGATGDPNLSDDTAAIQAAVDDATDGATIYFPRGVYAITSPIVISSPVRLLGDGTEYFGSTIYQFTPNTTALSFDTVLAGLNTQASSVEHMVITAGSDQTSGDGIYALADVHLRDVSVNHFYDAVRLGANSYFSRAYGSFFHGARSGIKLDSGVNNFSAFECQFWTSDYGLHSTGVQSLRIRDCAFESHGIAGIWVDGPNGGIVISGNYLENNDAGATQIIVGDTTLVTGVLIEGNWFDEADAASYHVELDHAAQVTFLANAYRIFGLGRVRSTANTTNVAVVNEQTADMSGMPGSTIVIDPSGANPWPSYRRKVLSTSGLVGYWRLGESTGTAAVDEVGTTNGVYVNTPTLGAPGAIADDYDRAVTLNGTDEYITVTPATAPVQDTFTIIAWVKRAAAGATHEIIGGKNNNFQLIWEANNHIYLNKNGGGALAINSGPYTDTASWHMIAATRVGGAAATKVFFDGSAATNTDGGNAVTCAWTNGDPIGIGADPFPGFYLAGSIDEVAIFDRALTDGEVANLWHLGSGS